jgi:predicted ArsR family transcriptional regulator
MTMPIALESEPTLATCPSWTFLSNHAHALICLARDGDCRVRDLALRIGITERAVQRILADLEAAGYLVRERHGRRNHHRLVLDRPMRHPLEASHTVGELVSALVVLQGHESAGR